jgi:hypothetical protein
MPNKGLLRLLAIMVFAVNTLIYLGESVILWDFSISAVGLRLFFVASVAEVLIVYFWGLADS